MWNAWYCQSVTTGLLGGQQTLPVYGLVSERAVFFSGPVHHSRSFGGIEVFQLSGVVPPYTASLCLTVSPWQHPIKVRVHTDTVKVASWAHGPSQATNNMLIMDPTQGWGHTVKATVFELEMTYFAYLFLWQKITLKDKVRGLILTLDVGVRATVFILIMLTQNSFQNLDFYSIVMFWPFECKFKFIYFKSVFQTSEYQALICRFSYNIKLFWFRIIKHVIFICHTALKFWKYVVGFYVPLLSADMSV